MMKQFLFCSLVAGLLFSCGTNAVEKKNVSHVQMSEQVKAMLDSVIKTSDTTYTKPYKRTDFVWATYYADKVNKSVCQMMKDSAGQIRQIILSKNNVRTFFAQYYPNGQLTDSLALDEFGQYHGPSVSYYETGIKKAEGNYRHGLHTGKWNNYDENGKLVSTDEYDTNGVQINK